MRRKGNHNIYLYDYRCGTYSALSLITEAGTTNAVGSDVGTDHRIYSQDGMGGRAGDISDYFRARSDLGSTDPNSYSVFDKRSCDYDETKRGRSGPNTADLLNSFSTDRFTFSKYINGSSTTIYSSNTTWSEVSAVPLPAAFPFLIAALGGLAFIGGRRRKAA